MTKFDRKIRKLSKSYKIPDTYYDKVDDIIDKLSEDNVEPPKNKVFTKAAVVMATIFVVLTGCLFASGTKKAEASLWSSFRQTIMDFFGVSGEDSAKMGIDSKKENAVSKPDLMMELQEVVMDTQNIYAVVKITAPSTIEFDSKMSFDYFGFCEGTNYNVSNVVGGARSCEVFELSKERPNIATFVVNIVTDKQIKEGKDVTVFFKDLIKDPREAEPDVLVSGLWSLSFKASYTKSEEINIKGTKDTKFTLLKKRKKVTIKKLKLMPLGMSMVVDVTVIPADILNTSDTRITVRLKMLDGSTPAVQSRDDEPTLSTSGSIANYDKKGKSYQKHVYQFDKAVDISKIMGVYVQDCYIPVKDYD